MRRWVRWCAAVAGGLAVACIPASCGSGGPAPEGEASAARDAAVDTVFSDIEDHAPGAAVAVRHEGAVVHLAGYGVADMDHGIPITPGTVFDIASVSKQFGAMSALLLEADGALDLDADVRTYVPELPDFGHTITARHLIHHTSGIRDWPHTMGLGGVEMSDVISFEKILRMLFRQRSLNFAPGSEYAYSNTGYNLLALIVERASGMTFREFTRDRIFSPLGMSDTHFSDDSNEIVAGRAESYAPREGEDAEPEWERRVNQLTALASSSLHTTAADFARWMANYETGVVGGPDVATRMTQRGVLTGGDTIAYAYGLTVDDYRGLRTFGHGGSWAGYRTNFVRFPDHDLSVAVFCNVTSCDPAGRARAVAEVFLADAMATERPGGDDDAGESPRPALSASELAEFAGEYRSPELDSTYDLFVRDARLLAEHWRGARVQLSPTGADTFTGDHPWFPEVRFLRDARGRVASFTVTGARVRDLVFERR